VRAAEYDAYGTADVVTIRDVDAPGDALAPGHVRVRVEATSVNPKDTFVRKGRFRALTGETFPKRVGYDWSGTIAGVGANVKRFAVGDRAFGMVNGWAGRTCAEFVDVAAAQSARLPARVSMAAGAAVPLAAQTALQALVDVANVRAGQRVFVSGASGGVGLFALAIASDLGASVTAAASAPNEKLCRDFGASAFADYAIAPLDTLGERFDIVFDVFGNLAFDAIEARLAPGGILVTTVPSAATMLAVAAPHADGKRVRLVSVNSRARDLDTLAWMLDRETLRVHIDATYTLADLASAHAYVERKHTRGKVVVTIP
jgi:NADPH:quinone reductase-like Zn-dependent oxidoreductase